MTTQNKIEYPIDKFEDLWLTKAELKEKYGEERTVLVGQTERSSTRNDEVHKERNIDEIR